MADVAVGGLVVQLILRDIVIVDNILNNINNILNR